MSLELVTTDFASQSIKVPVGGDQASDKRYERARMEGLNYPHEVACHRSIVVGLAVVASGLNDYGRFKFRQYCAWSMA